MTEAAPIVCAVASRTLRGDVAALTWLRALRRDRCPWLLESALPDHPLSRFSFVGSDPYAVVRGWVRPRPRRVETLCVREVRPDLPVGRRVCDGALLRVLRDLLPRLDRDECPRGPAGPAALPFVGGAVGWFGYELARDLDPVELRATDDLGLPDAAWLLVDRLVAVDAQSGEAWALGLGFGSNRDEARGSAERAARELSARLACVVPEARRVIPDVAPCPVQARGSFDESSYPKAVEAIREQIGVGNVYQACLTQRLDMAFGGDPVDLYAALRSINPAPFAAYLELPEAVVVGSSPERFLRIEADGRVESRPIKGTRPRGVSPEEDHALRRELQASAKDRAENLMIVDLVRNDLGRVCETGSVRVPELFRLEAFATVHQMVSVVEGRLAAGRDALDAVAAAFPPGSMTGAPKLAAMRILDALEPVCRGIYSGAVGYLDARGGADLAVVIRTLVVQDGRAHAGVGGGVVADSHPRAEHRESLDKARALLDALGYCREAFPRGNHLHPHFSEVP